MAEKTKTEKMIFNVPLGDAWKVPYKRRAKKCIFLIKEFAVRHMKAERANVKIGQQLNLEIWARGIKSPPRDVKVQAVPNETAEKTEVWVELADVELKLPEKEKEKGKMAGLKEKLLPKIKEKAADAVTEEVIKEKIEEVAKKEKEAKPAEKKTTEAKKKKEEKPAEEKKKE